MTNTINNNGVLFRMWANNWYLTLFFRNALKNSIVPILYIGSKTQNNLVYFKDELVGHQGGSSQLSISSGHDLVVREFEPHIGLTAVSLSAQSLLQILILHSSLNK